MRKCEGREANEFCSAAFYQRCKTLSAPNDKMQPRSPFFPFAHQKVRKLFACHSNALRIKSVVVGLFGKAMFELAIIFDKMPLYFRMMREPSFINLQSILQPGFLVFTR